MIDEETYEPAIEKDAFEVALRNIRIQLDGRTLIIDLIPSVELDEYVAEVIPGGNPELNKILAGSKPIVESNRFLRAYFDGIMALFIQEEFVEILDILAFDFNKKPRFENGQAYPFLHVVNSRWKRCLPDYQGRDDPNLKHFKIVSMETCVDLLGYFEKVEWLDSKKS